MLTSTMSRVAGVVLAGFLQIAPLVMRMVDSAPAMGSSPVAVVLKWVVGAMALGGALHTVSAATATLLSAKSVSGTVGTRLSYQIKISDGRSRLPNSWTIQSTGYNWNAGTITNGMPPGLSIDLATAIIGGIPTQSGTFPTTITGWENTGQRGGHLTFTVTFTFTGGSVAPSISTQPVGSTVHPGDTLTLGVVAAGTGPLTYQWFKDGALLTKATNATYSASPATSKDSGSYTVVVTGPGGSVTSSAAVVAVRTLGMGGMSRDATGFSMLLQTVKGRSYVVEAVSSLDAPWVAVGTVDATADSATFKDPAVTGATRFWRYRPRN